MKIKFTFIVFYLICSLSASIINDSIVSPGEPQVVQNLAIDISQIQPFNTQDLPQIKTKAKTETIDKQVQQFKISENILKDLFQQYFQKYQSSFSTNNNHNSDRLSYEQIKAYRQKVFYQNVEIINKHNLDENRTFDMGINYFTIVTQEQFIKQFNVPLVHQEQSSIPPKRLLEQYKDLNNTESLIDQTSPNYKAWQNNPDCQPIIKSNQTKPKFQIDGKKSITNDIIDWRCVIKDMPIFQQGQCGACLVISTLSSISISLKIQSIQHEFFSVQQLLACDKNQTYFGCDGGDLQSAFIYVQKYGVGPEKMYPYEGNDKNCDICLLADDQYKDKKFYLKGRQRIPPNHCQKLIEVLRTRAVAVGISTIGSQFYKNGIFRSKSSVINHAVTLVGYHPQKGFLIRNSWGEGWGMSGYAYVSEFEGICKDAIAPII